MLTSDWSDYLRGLPAREALILGGATFGIVAMIATVLAGFVWGWL